MKASEQRRITPEGIRRYVVYLREQEKAPATVSKYAHDLNGLLRALPDGRLTKSGLIQWKEQLTAQYAAASVNVTLAAVNGFLIFNDWRDCVLKPLRIQRDLFCREERELTREEYVRLVRAAERRGDRRLSLVLQTICATGIRVSELRFITAEAVRTGRAEVNNKGKRRTVLIPRGLCRLLLQYGRRSRRTAGAIFVTRTGSPLDRSNIWREMKGLCADAGVPPEKVFPHNLRHLFARIYYAIEKDLSKLADLLGHSNVNTTRIYTAESGVAHARQMERMGLIIT